jgi:hypothetical protein
LEYFIRFPVFALGDAPRKQLSSSPPEIRDQVFPVHCLSTRTGPKQWREYNYEIYWIRQHDRASGYIWNGHTC